ncbi:MAG: PorV/PorQ family protein, partial [Planctomycetes bacterium]|nr:PorV/PorQ family protein [Planctomycetota bacterium]
IETQGDDVWFVTNAGVERYNSAKSQIGMFYEKLLPALNIDDLFHAFCAASFPLQEWGTVGGFVNFISFGEIPITYENDEGGEPQKFSSWECVAATSYGTKISKRSSFGLNIKFIYSALAPGISASGEEQDGVAASYAVDLGLLSKNIIFKGLNFGFVMQNIGPAVFYVDQDQSDPIPFTWKFGLSYNIASPSHRLIVAADLNREATYHDEDHRGGATPVYIGAWKDL